MLLFHYIQRTVEPVLLRNSTDSQLNHPRQIKIKKVDLFYNGEINKLLKVQSNKPNLDSLYFHKEGWVILTLPE